MHIVLRDFQLKTQSTSRLFLKKKWNKIYYLRFGFKSVQKNFFLKKKYLNISVDGHISNTQGFRFDTSLASSHWPWLCDILLQTEKNNAERIFIEMLPLPWYGLKQQQKQHILLELYVNARFDIIIKCTALLLMYINLLNFAYLVFVISNSGYKRLTSNASAEYNYSINWQIFIKWLEIAEKS